MFVEILPHIAVSYFVQKVKGRSSRRVQQEFPELRNRYWGQKVLGKKLLLHDKRKYYRRHHHGVSRRAFREAETVLRHRRTYRHQSVVV